jgi:hypothetical protein
LFTTGYLPDALEPPIVLSDVLKQAPGWRWGNPLTGDPLTRADDKGFSELRGRPEALATALLTIRDERTRGEIRLRAERRCRVLERQLADARQAGIACLADGAERELADQRLLVLRIAATT